jgi:hypothetical protein
MNQIATFAILLFLASTLAYAKPAPKEKETIEVEISSVKTNIYTTYTRSTSWVMSKLPKDSYTYTDIIFAVVDGKHVVYTCADRKKVCPVLEAGTKVSAERDGDSIYISSTVPTEKKPVVAHYKIVSGSW